MMSAVFVCCLFLSQQINAQSVINGYASISFDENTNILTGVVTTELDFSAQDWYQARVNGSLYDDEYNVLTSAYANDNLRSGTVSVVMQANRNSSLGFTAKGTNIAIADIQDYSMGSGYYVDYHNFYEIRDSEGYYHLRVGTWWGMGPRRTLRLQNIFLGSTLAQHKVVGYRNATLCNSTTEFVDYGRAKVTIDAASAGCTTEDPCATGPDERFNVTIDFVLPDSTTA